MPTTPASSGNRSRSEFLNRLGVYLLGVSIGLLIVGGIWQARKRRQAELQTIAEQTDAAGATGTPEPTATQR